MAEVAYFYVYKDTAKEWRWKFVAKNSKTIAVSSESYHNLVDCEHAISLLKQQGSTAPVVGDDEFKRNRAK
ncbi:YegP family protein [Pseudomonas sp. A014]|uniref:YegP family protein n=1 Tax=Pseudomonas sp. A014 TaxID=3458058 RepID=UPI0040367847